MKKWNPIWNRGKCRLNLCPDISWRVRSVSKTMIFSEYDNLGSDVSPSVRPSCDWLSTDRQINSEILFGCVVKTHKKCYYYYCLRKGDPNRVVNHFSAPSVRHFKRLSTHSPKHSVFLLMNASFAQIFGDECLSPYKALSVCPSNITISEQFLCYILWSDHWICLAPDPNSGTIS